MKINNTPFEFHETLNDRLLHLHNRVKDMREVGTLSQEVLKRIRE